jgi:AbiV
LLTVENVTEKQLREICKKCIENSSGLLEATELLLPNNNTLQFSLGLYMYAIEEYWKAHLLKGCFIGTKNVYSIPGWIFGWERPPSGKTSHEEKLSEGFRNLPSVCLKLSNVIEIVYNTSPKTQTFTIKGSFRNGSVSVGPYQSGIFEDPTLPGPGDVDLDLKTACFYVDLDEANRRPKFLIPAERKQLTHNIKRVKENVQKFDFI